MAHVGAEWEGSAVRTGLLDGGDVQSAHMLRIRGFSQNDLPFSNKFLVLPLQIPAPLSN